MADVDTFEELAEEFNACARKLVWCNVATVDRRGRPRSRILHPLWEGPLAWVGTYPGSHKAKHLASNPHISCAYVDPVTPAYADCRAEWVNEIATKKHVWEYMKSLPEPYGFDPATIWQSYDHEQFGLLKLIPWRMQVTTANPGAPAITKVWRNPAGGA